MTATQGNLASLSRFIFRAPRWYSSLAFALLIAAVAGVAAFDTGSGLVPWNDALEGVFYIGIPTVVAGFGTTAVDRWLDGQLTPNRSSLLALFCELVLVALMVTAGALAALTSFQQQFVMHALIAGLAGIFAIRLLVVKAISRTSLPVAAIPASIQTATAALLLFVYSGAIRFFEIQRPLVASFLSRPDHAPEELTLVAPQDFVLLGLLCGVYALGVWGFLVAIDRPWRNTLGVSVLDFARGFVGHIAEGSRELEEFFETLGEDAEVPVTVLSFRRPNGTEKARFVLPMIHPGPMGDIGGGNLPVRVAGSTEGLAFPPHATAGHDFNLVTEREVDTLVEAAERAHGDIEYGDAATRGVRVEHGDATLLGQALGDDLLVVSTFAPGFADDVEFAVGLSAMAEARAAGFEDVLLVDAHNSNNGLEGEDLGHVVPGDGRSFDLIEGAGEAAERLAAAERGPLRLGTAWEPTDWTPPEGIGPLGVRVAVTEVGGATTAYVLVDGNNMEPGLRGRIVEAVDGVDEVEVMTTDTHIVNTVEAENQVGEAIDQGRLVELIERLVEEALEDLEPVEAGMAQRRAEVTVFGNDRTETLASYANAMISIGGALAGASIVVAVMLAAILFFVT
jgi:putative membrane protein